MSDLVEQLRALNDGVSRPVTILEREVCGKAADRIEALEAALERAINRNSDANERIEVLEAALREIIEEGGFRDSAASKIARAALAPEQAEPPTRITGAANIVDEAACAIWSELCPGMVMGDEDRPYYEAAAKAVFALSHRVLQEIVNDANRALKTAGDQTFEDELAAALVTVPPFTKTS